MAVPDKFLELSTRHDWREANDWKNDVNNAVLRARLARAASFELADLGEKGTA